MTTPSTAAPTIPALFPDAFITKIDVPFTKEDGSPYPQFSLSDAGQGTISINGPFSTTLPYPVIDPGSFTAYASLHPAQNPMWAAAYQAAIKMCMDWISTQMTLREIAAMQSIQKSLSDLRDDIHALKVRGVDNDLGIVVQKATWDAGSPVNTKLMRKALNNEIG